MSRALIKKLILILILITAFAYIESAIVIYLRHIYYPEGFHFPIKRHYDYILTVEFIREMATLVILTSLSVLFSKSFWEGFGYFLVMFGLWDIFFYIFLKLAINWPATIFDWDILFLIPLPWIGPVISAVSISLIMIIMGCIIIQLFERGYIVKPTLIHWILVMAGNVLILFSFMHDIDAAFHEKYPKPYLYEFLVIGEGLYIIAFVLLYKRTIRFKDGKI
ncbi:MAG: hypothetical protein ACRDFC_09115 [Ignavibacteria bacterium]